MRLNTLGFDNTLDRVILTLIYVWLNPTFTHAMVTISATLRATSTSLDGVRLGIIMHLCTHFPRKEITQAKLLVNFHVNRPT